MKELEALLQTAYSKWLFLNLPGSQVSQKLSHVQIILFYSLCFCMY